MKKLFVLLISLVVAASIYASRLVQVNGELTGAGSKFYVKDLVALVSEDQIFQKEKIERIHVKNGKEPKISDITAVQIEGELINAKEFNGFIIQQ